VDGRLTYTMGFDHPVTHLLKDGTPVEDTVRWMDFFEVAFELRPRIGRYQIVVDWASDMRPDTRVYGFNKEFSVDPSFLAVQPVYPDDDALVLPP